MTLKIEFEDLMKVLDKAADQEKVFEAAMKLYAESRLGRFDNVPNAQWRLTQETEAYLRKWHPGADAQVDYLEDLTGSHD